MGTVEDRPPKHMVTNNPVLTTTTIAEACGVLQSAPCPTQLKKAKPSKKGQPLHVLNSQHSPKKRLQLRIRAAFEK